MVALYVTSLARAAGKTAVCAGIGKQLQLKNKRVGFFKPIITDNKDLPEAGTDSDAVFMKQILALEEPVESLCPVISDLENLSDKISEAYVKVASGKDVTIIEGIFHRSQDSGEIVKALDARVLVVESYSEKLLKAMPIDSYKGFDERLLGVILNKVPERRVEFARGEVATQFVKAGIELLGVLPEDRVLLAPTIGELAEQLQGEVLNSTEKSPELVENLMLGAMYIGSGLDYFGRKSSKAVVLRSERPDMQLAALETSTRCLILSGNAAPFHAVLYQAENKKVPIIQVKSDIITTVAGIEGALAKVRFNQGKKLPRLIEMIEQHINLPTVYNGLGLAN